MYISFSCRSRFVGPHFDQAPPPPSHLPGRSIRNLRFGEFLAQPSSPPPPLLASALRSKEQAGPFYDPAEASLRHLPEGLRRKCAVVDTTKLSKEEVRRLYQRRR